MKRVRDSHLTKVFFLINKNHIQTGFASIKVHRLVSCNENKIK